MPDNFVTIGRLRATTIARIPVGLSSEVVRRVRDEIVRRYPGATRTAMRARAFPGEDPASVKPPEDVAAQILSLLAR